MTVLKVRGFFKMSMEPNACVGEAQVRRVLGVYKASMC